MGYLTSDDVLDITKFIHSPPTADSALFAYDKSQFENGLSFKGTAIWDEWIQALPDIAHTGLIFGRIPGLTISESETPKIYAMLGEIIDDYKLIIGPGKFHYERVSPYQYYNFLPPAIPAPEAVSTTSYPSGRTCNITACALILVTLFPEKADEIMQKAYSVCNMLVSVGFHWYTDIEASKLLGGLLFNQLMSNAEFQADLELCKVEASQIA